MIAISNSIADDIGTIWIRNFQMSGEYRSSARIAKHKLLDGGTYFSHLGVSDTDRELPIECRLDATQQANVKTLYESGAVVVINFWEGSFLCLIGSLDIDRAGKATITFYFKEKLS